MNRRYPIRIFLLGVLMNFLFHFFPLFLLGAVLCIIGIWSKPWGSAGGAILLLDLILSVIEQLRTRKAALSESENPEFNELMDAFYGPDGSPEKVKQIIDDKISQSSPVDGESLRERYENEARERTETLQTLLVYRNLRDSIRKDMTLEETIGAFAQMCKLPVGEPDDLLFESGTYNFSGEKLFHFSLVRQFQFLDEEEYVQLHLDVCYKPCSRNFGMRCVHWGSATEGDFFGYVLGSPAYHAVKEMPPIKVDVYIDET